MSHQRPPSPAPCSPALARPRSPGARPFEARRPPAVLVALVALASAQLLSCKERPSPPPAAESSASAPSALGAAAPARAPVGPVAPALDGPPAGVASAEGMPVSVELDPAGPPGDLAAEVAAFVDLPSCVQMHRPSDPLLAEGLEALGYERFTWDACRGVEALKRRRPEPCDAMLSSALRRRCVSNLAVFNADPSLCPLDEPAPGLAQHDVACLAAARRDLRTCAGLRGPARAVCEGLLVHDRTRCGTDERCVRQIVRWQNALPLAPNVIPYRARASVRLEGPAGGSAPLEETLELADEAAQGAVLVRRSAGRIRLAIGEVSPARVSALPAPALGLWVEAPEALLATGGEAELSGAELGVLLKTPRGLLPRAAGQGARLRLEALTPEPHRPLRLTLEVVVGPGDAPRRAIFTIDTWLRDIVERPAPPR